MCGARGQNGGARVPESSNSRSTRSNTASGVTIRVVACGLRGRQQVTDREKKAMNLSIASLRDRGACCVRGLQLHTPMPPEIDPDAPPPPATDPDPVPDDDPATPPSRAPDGDPPVKPPPIRAMGNGDSGNVARMRSVNTRTREHADSRQRC
jgi:hypothetical protein